MSRLPNVQTLPGVDDDATRSDPHADRHVHIVLLGLMGAGKSTVGHLVANELGRPFVDSDSMVQLRTGFHPPGLAERAGLDELHAAELAALRHVLEQHDSVVFAAAASVVDVVDAADLHRAWCVWLDAAPAVLAERVTQDHHERPLLGDQPEAVLAEQHARRSTRGHELAMCSIATDDRTAAEVAATICNAWREWATS